MQPVNSIKTGTTWKRVLVAIFEAESGTSASLIPLFLSARSSTVKTKTTERD